MVAAAKRSKKGVSATVESVSAENSQLRNQMRELQEQMRVLVESTTRIAQVQTGVLAGSMYMPSGTCCHFVICAPSVTVARTHAPPS